MRHEQRRRFAVALSPLALAASLAALPAEAATRYWSYIGGCGPTQADWFSTTAGPNAHGMITCWSDIPFGLTGFGAPGANDDVYFFNPTAGQTLLVTFAQPIRPTLTGTARDIFMQGSTSFATGLAIASQSLSARSLILGTSGSGVLGRVDQSGGTVSASNGVTVYGGDYNLSDGTLIAPNVLLRSQKAGARFTQTGGQLVAADVSVGGDYGASATFSQIAGNVTSATLTIGSLPLATTGIVEVSGSARWVNSGASSIGALGGGSLSISSGGLMQTASAVVGQAPGAIGVAAVKGNGSAWTVTGLLTVGDGGSGRVVASDRGTISASGLVANGVPTGGATVSISGSGTALNVGNSLVIGRTRGAQIEVLDGAALAANFGVVGEGAGTESFAKLAGASSVWDNRVSLVVGSDGKGTLQVDSGLLKTVDAAVGMNAGSTGFVKLDGGQSSWASSGTLRVGQAGSGTFGVTGGAHASTAHVLLGDAASGSGTVTLSGGTWTNASEFALGNNGSGLLNVNAGSTLTTGSLLNGYGKGSGTVNVNGSGAWLGVTGTASIGRIGTGTLNLGGGAAMESSLAALGDLAGSSGIAVVNGASWNNTNDLLVGNNGTGVLQLGAGGLVKTRTLAVGNAFGSVGTLQIAGPGATLQASGPATIGGFGTGTLTIGTEGKLKSGGAVLGSGPAGSGTATISGANALWTIGGDLDVGLQGRGRMTVGAQGTVDVAGTTRVGTQGVLTLDGGTLATGSAQLGDTSRFDWRAGTLRVKGNAAMDGGALPTLVLLSSARSLQVDQTLALGSGSALLLAGGGLKAGTLSFDNAVIAASGGPQALDMNQIGLLSGRGSVAARVVGGFGGNNTINATGALTLGLAAAADSINFAGTLQLNGQQVVLLDADLAELGGNVQIGTGGRLASVNGTWLTPGAMLWSSVGSVVQGSFVNDGTVHSQGGPLTFTDAVGGSGSFAGDVHFDRSYAPGNSTAIVRFGNGAATFSTGSVLTLEINGTTAGSGFDRLADIDTFTFDGTLALNFGTGFQAAKGTKLQLLDFDVFHGQLDASHVVVKGFDRSQLDLSRLAVDGSITISAVPEPGTWALWLGGLAAVSQVVRRRRA
jgi:T5SS/PEP-CTERM-associated repeat protein